jgi:hypothetical protein
MIHRGKHNPPLPATVDQIRGDRDRLIEHSAELRRFDPEVVLDMIAGDQRQAAMVVNTFRGIARRLVITGQHGCVRL